ncbi:MAG: zf-HC2 domain-containing protein [Planctomycetes bacterium]|nr:zf-HC2 domain-containing protein [Planctomycetota bacterium]
MSCDEVKSRLGEWLDGESPTEQRQVVGRHLDDCPDCRSEYESLQLMAAAIARPPEAKLPAGLWEAIERRLDEAPPMSTPSAEPAPHRLWIYKLARRPLAAAAVVVLAIGLGWLAFNGPWEPRAMAAQIDFRPLLEQADGDIAAGIRALMQAYGGERISPEDAAKRMKVRVHAPDELPGELRLKARYLLNMGKHHQALAFHYTTPSGGHLLLLQCPPKVEKNYGDYECLPCSVGSHGGHGVRVGKLYLMHMASNDVCVCVVTTLDEPKLGAALGGVKISF